jgi:phosphate transport system substrate-binding protein
MMEDLAAAYAARDPLLTIDVVPANSAMARDMLDAGQVDMAVVSRGVGMAPPPPWRGPTAKVLALDAVTVVVHRQSSLSAVTSAQLAALYAGDYGDWSQLGAGQGRPEVVVRDAGSALQQMFEDAVLDHRSLSSTAVVMPHDRGVIEYVASHPNAIGYISRAYVHEGVKAIPLNGVAPTPQAIQRKDYSMWYSLEALISPQAHPQAARLITFAQSGRGRQVIEDRYVLPR